MSYGFFTIRRVRSRLGQRCASGFFAIRTKKKNLFQYQIIIIVTLSAVIVRACVAENRYIHPHTARAVVTRARENGRRTGMPCRRFCFLSAFTRRCPTETTWWESIKNPAPDGTDGHSMTDSVLPPCDFRDAHPSAVVFFFRSFVPFRTHVRKTHVVRTPKTPVQVTSYIIIIAVFVCEITGRRGCVYSSAPSDFCFVEV